MKKDIRGEHIDRSVLVGTASTDIYEVPEGYILVIEELVVQKDGTAGTVTLTDEGTYKDGTTSYSKTVHTQYLAANDFDDTKDFNVEVYGTLKGVSSSGNTTVQIKGWLK